MAQMQGQETAKELQLVGFELCDEKFAVEILSVREIIPIGAITRVPNSPDFVEGIINLRGEVIPVIDLRKRIGVGKRDFQKATRIVVVELEEHKVGFIVDVVSQVLRISTDAIEPPPPMVTGIGSEYLKGVARVDGNLLMLLDLRQILSSGEQTEIRRVA